jgi:hypothetical protein
MPELPVTAYRAYKEPTIGLYFSDYITDFRHALAFLFAPVPLAPQTAHTLASVPDSP